MGSLINHRPVGDLHRCMRYVRDRQIEPFSGRRADTVRRPISCDIACGILGCDARRVLRTGNGWQVPVLRAGDHIQGLRVSSHALGSRVYQLQRSLSSIHEVPILGLHSFHEQHSEGKGWNQQLDWRLRLDPLLWDVIEKTLGSTVPN
jgi:hypothetical protein